MPGPSSGAWAAPSVPGQAASPAPAGQFSPPSRGPGNPAGDLSQLPPPSPTGRSVRPGPSDHGGGPSGWAPPAASPGPGTQWAPPQPGPAGPSAPAPRVGSYAPQIAATPRRGYVITVTAPKGGTGKSSLTLNMAAYLGLRLRPTGRNVCVIDTNFQQADAGKYLGSYNPNITSVVRDPTSLSVDRIQEFLIHRPEFAFSALLGPAVPDDANPVYINAQLYLTVLGILRQLYDYILIDTAVAEKYHSLFQEFALPEADFLVIPVTPNIPTLMDADLWLRDIVQPRHAKGLGIDPEKIGIVLNRYEDDIGCDEDEVRNELAQWRYIGNIPETKEWKRCNNMNELVATKNYSELNAAFANALYIATGEEILVEGPSHLAPTKRGFTSRLANLVKGRK